MWLHIKNVFFVKKSVGKEFPFLYWVAGKVTIPGGRPVLVGFWPEGSPFYGLG